MPRRSQPKIVARYSPAPGTLRRDRLFFAAYYLIAFAALGYFVAHRPPTQVDLALRPIAGDGTGIASVLSFAGTFPVYVGMSLFVLVLGFVKRDLLRPALMSVVTLVAAWRVSDACKALFARPRPPYWFVHHETSLSYPSGHATLVVAFYGFWTAVVWARNVPIATKRWVRLGFAASAIGIGWSRLALGAHYLTDVIGGYLLGAAFASLAMLAFDSIGSD